jgi:NitT/TauT family transport system ATP-binding protein
METPSSSDAARDVVPGGIRLEGVSKDFERGGVTYRAIEDVSLSIPAGEFFCLLGPSGCGKTTILNMLAGFEQPSHGRIVVHDREVKGPGSDRGVVFQSDAALFSWLTVRENVEFGPSLRGAARQKRREAADHYLQMVGLTAHAAKYPAELSGGMRQRVQLARCLANDPEVLLMDEPFGALDAQTRRVMQQEMGRIWQETGRTVLFITHDIDEAIVLGSRIGVMNVGPGSRIKAIIDNPLPRPRVRDANTLELFAEINRLIEEEQTELR